MFSVNEIFPSYTDAFVFVELCKLDASIVKVEIAKEKGERIVPLHSLKLTTLRMKKIATECRAYGEIVPSVHLTGDAPVLIHRLQHEEEASEFLIDLLYKNGVEVVVV